MQTNCFAIFHNNEDMQMWTIPAVSLLTMQWCIYDYLYHIIFATSGGGAPSRDSSVITRPVLTVVIMSSADIRVKISLVKEDQICVSYFVNSYTVQYYYHCILMLYHIVTHNIVLHTAVHDTI